MTDATINDQGTLTPDRTIVPSFDGDRDESSGIGFRTPIWSHGDWIYATANAPNGGHDSPKLSEIVQIRKSDGVEVDRVRIDPNGADIANNSGHHAVPMGIDGDGRIYTRRAVHQTYSNLLIRRTTTPGDIESFTTLTEPSRTNNWRDQYRRFFVSPDGVVFLWTRSSHDQMSSGLHSLGLLWRYDAGSGQMVNVVGSGATPLQETEPRRVWNWHQAWDSNGRLYGISSIGIGTSTGSYVDTTADAGYSDDDGATWSDLEGGSITLPFASDSVKGTPVFPTAHHRPQIVVTPDDNLVFVGAWVGPTGTDEDALSLWVRRWNTDTEQFDATYKIEGHSNVNFKPDQQVYMAPDGAIWVTANREADERLYLYATYPGEDFLSTWDRWQLPEWCYHGYLDPAGHEDDVVRILAVERVEDVASSDEKAEILEVSYATNVDNGGNGGGTVFSEWSSVVSSGGTGNITSEWSEWVSDIGPSQEDHHSGSSTVEIGISPESESTVGVSGASTEDIDVSVESNSTIAISDASTVTVDVIAEGLGSDDQTESHFGSSTVTITISPESESTINVTDSSTVTIYVSVEGQGTSNQSEDHSGSSTVEIGISTESESNISVSNSNTVTINVTAVGSGFTDIIPLRNIDVDFNLPYREIVEFSTPVSATDIGIIYTKTDIDTPILSIDKEFSTAELRLLSYSTPFVIKEIEQVYLKTHIHEPTGV